MGISAILSYIIWRQNFRFIVLWIFLPRTKIFWSKSFITPPSSGTSTQQALEKLDEIRAIELKCEDKIYFAHTEISGIRNKILRALSCKIASTIMSEIVVE